MNKILITGASGFIGGFIVEEALRRGFEVWAGVRSGSSLARLQDNRINFINLKYDDEAALTEQLRKFAQQNGAWNYIVHNAGVTKTLNYKNFYRVNSQNTRHLINALITAECIPEKFVLMSSLSSFGPIKESSLQPIKNNDKQLPDSHYGKSKLQAESHLKSQNKIPYIILRPTGVYGPGDKDYLMEIKSIKSGFDFKVGMKPQHITFIYVKDLVQAIFLAAEKKEITRGEYFVADGDVYTDAEFSALVQILLGKKFVIHARIPCFIAYIACQISELIGRIKGKITALNTDKYYTLRQRNWICDIEPIRKKLDFKPKYNLESGLRETIEYEKNKGFI